MRMRLDRWGLCALVSLSASGCQEPTQVELRVSTDLPCSEVHGTTVTVGQRGELEAAHPATTLATCERGADGSQHLGFVVFVPRGENDEAFALKVVTAVSARSPDACQPGEGSARGYQGCIVARRELRYRPGHTLRLEVPMLQQCEGVECTVDSTCFDATTCIPAGVTCTKEACTIDDTSDRRFANPSGPGAAAGGAAGAGGGFGGSGGGGGQAGAGGEAGASGQAGDGGSGGAGGQAGAGASGGASGQAGAGGEAGSGSGASAGNGPGGSGGTGGQGGGGAGGNLDSCISNEVWYCGNQSPDGCFCDDGCEQFNDCCPDKLDVCGRSSESLGSVVPVPDSVSDTVLIIDSSHSMVWNDPSGARKDAAKTFVALSQDDNNIAVVDFDSVVTDRIGLTPLSEGSDALRAAIDQIDSSGGDDLGAGVQRAYEILAGGYMPWRNAVLLTDGHGAYNNEHLQYAANGWMIWTIGVGAANKTLLCRIAEETGGVYNAGEDCSTALTPEAHRASGFAGEVDRAPPSRRQPSPFAAGALTPEALRCVFDHIRAKTSGGADVSCARHFAAGRTPFEPAYDFDAGGTITVDHLANAKSQALSHERRSPRPPMGLSLLLEKLGPREQRRPPFLQQPRPMRPLLRQVASTASSTTPPLGRKTTATCPSPAPSMAPTRPNCPARYAPPSPRAPPAHA